PAAGLVRATLDDVEHRARDDQQPDDREQRVKRPFERVLLGLAHRFLDGKDSLFESLHLFVSPLVFPVARSHRWLNVADKTLHLTYVSVTFRARIRTASA